MSTYTTVNRLLLRYPLFEEDFDGEDVQVGELTAQASYGVQLSDDVSEVEETTLQSVTIVRNGIDEDGEQSRTAITFFADEIHALQEFLEQALPQIGASR